MEKTLHPWWSVSQCRGLGVTPGQIAEIPHATQPKKTQPTEQSTCCLGSITEDKTSESEINRNCPVSTTERKERLEKGKGTGS